MGDPDKTMASKVIVHLQSGPHHTNISTNNTRRAFALLDHSPPFRAVVRCYQVSLFNYAPSAQNEGSAHVSTLVACR